jgi:predicted membrane channel-forming protein YqfA (hemolysin III family)
MAGTMRKRVLGWIWTGCLGGIAAAGVVFTIMAPERAAMTLAGLVFILIGLAGLGLQVMGRILRRRR